MANLILRPIADGLYRSWQGYVGAVPHASAFDLINEADADGDATYVVADTPVAFTVGLSNVVGGSWPRATRVPSVRVVAVVRTTGVGASFRFRLRLLGTDYDSAVYTATAAYTDVGVTYDRCPNEYDWDLATLNQLEIGLVWVAGDALRCTKLELFVHDEAIPHYTLSPNAAGTVQDWAVFPAMSPAHMVVSGAFDGDLSYIHDTIVNNISTFAATNLPTTLHPPNISRVAVQTLVKNKGTLDEHAGVILRSGGVNWRGGTNTVGKVISADSKWHRIREDYLNDPTAGWPSGLPAATAWTDVEVNALEIGIENAGGGSFRCTDVSLDVWLAPTPITTIAFGPIADGLHTDWNIVVPGPDAWSAICEDPPDDIVSYIVLDADLAGAARYSSFEFSTAGVVPAGQRISHAYAQHRVRLANLPHSEALVATVIRGAGETYVSRPQKIEGTGGLWFDLVHDFPTNPITGLPWADLAEVASYEWGFAVLEGAMLLSRTYIYTPTVQDYRGVSDPTDYQLTDDATVTYLPRSLTDGTIYAVTQFSVGTAGYLVPEPYTVTAVNPADVALGNEVYRGNIAWLEYDGLSTPWTVDYWCRVPRDVAQGGIGEIGLWAEILWSPFPAEIGTFFLFALAHVPCQGRHPNAVMFFKLRVEY